LARYSGRPSHPVVSLLHSAFWVTLSGCMLFVADGWYLFFDLLLLAYGVTLGYFALKKLLPKTFDSHAANLPIDTDEFDNFGDFGVWLPNQERVNQKVFVKYIEIETLEHAQPQAGPRPIGGSIYVKSRAREGSMECMVNSSHFSSELAFANFAEELTGRVQAAREGRAYAAKKKGG